MTEQTDETFEVEAIIDHRLLSDGTPEFLVKWVGYSHAENTWEPFSSLSLALEALKCYTDRFNAENPIRAKTEEQVCNKKGPKGKKVDLKKVKKEATSEPQAESSKSKRTVTKRKAKKPLEDDIDEDFMAQIEELKSDKVLIRNELSRIAENPLGRGLCVFCGGHFAAELCKRYPTHKSRMRLVEREHRCKACGSKEHKMKKFPPCNPSWCLFCQKQGHIQHMCKIFQEGVIDPYVH